MLGRLLWLLEGLSGPSAPAQAGDVSALALVDQLLGLERDFAIDAPSTLATTARVAANEQAPPSARGACFAVLWRHRDEGEPEAQLVAAAKAYPGGVQLGDFLYGLFALARNECVRSPLLIRALDEVVGAMSGADFLQAAPALRQAFHYFPPRERADIATLVSKLHGGDSALDPDWLRLPATVETIQRSARLLQAVAVLRTKYGL
jgi:hypothetical protein